LPILDRFRHVRSGKPDQVLDGERVDLNTAGIDRGQPPPVMAERHIRKPGIVLEAKEFSTLVVQHAERIPSPN
jgi:hypothetical protein